jgi:6-phosphogluconolactonase
MTTTRVHRLAGAHDASRAAAAFVANAAVEALQARGTCAIALAGGATPRALYAELAREPYRSLVPWNALDFYWGDERAVPPSHPDSNYGVAHETLLAHVRADRRRVYRIEGERDPGVAAAGYEATIRSTFHLDPADLPRFDLVLLGLGADGHTASLFPGAPALDERRALVRATCAPDLKTARITMTLPLLNAARRVLFLATGTGKADAVRLVLESGASAGVPAARVQPGDGCVDWILDAAAARLLSGAPDRAEVRI